MAPNLDNPRSKILALGEEGQEHRADELEGLVHKHYDVACELLAEIVQNGCQYRGSLNQRENMPGAAIYDNLKSVVNLERIERGSGNL